MSEAALRSLNHMGEKGAEFNNVISSQLSPESSQYSRDSGLEFQAWSRLKLCGCMGKIS